MRLVDKFTIWFLLVSAFILVAGGLVVFTRVQYEVDREAIRRIKSHIDDVAKQLEQGKRPDELRGEHLEIEVIDASLPEIDINVYDTMAVYRPRMEALDRKLTVESSYHIDGNHYRISMYDFVAEPDEIADGVKESVGWMFLGLLAIVGLTNLVISRRILAPFHKTLKAIQQFSLKNDGDLNLPATRTLEFQQLNYFLEGMTKKARIDYKALKEFTENASHELQTPLAIIRGKLELLLESPLNEEQGSQILSALGSIERLSKINSSLTLLNKLENQEFTVTVPVDLGLHVGNILHELSELIEMKSLVLRHDIHRPVRIQLHPSLADILVTNLLSNAIRHNIPGGDIYISLTSARLLVENSGHPPAMPVAQAFERFKRTTDNDDSVGLGLAIVKQICQLMNFGVVYTYHDGRHTVVVNFSSC